MPTQQKIEQAEPKGTGGGDDDSAVYVLVQNWGPAPLYVGPFADEEAAGAFGARIHNTVMDWQIVHADPYEPVVMTRAEALEYLDRH